MTVRSCIALGAVAFTVLVVFTAVKSLDPATLPDRAMAQGSALAGFAPPGPAAHVPLAGLQGLPAPGAPGKFPDGCVEGRVLQESKPPLKGEDVRELQVYLAGLGWYKGPLDGVYGKSTADAVRALQRGLGVPATGVYDSSTWMEIEGDATVEWASVPPPGGKVHLVIDLRQCSLTVYSDGAVHKSYTVAIGKPETPSPVGEFKIVWKSSGWGGGFGSRWLGINVPWGIYGIHGTNMPWTIGYMASHGCFRMFNHDVEEIFPWVDIGTPVIIEGDLSHVKCREVLRRGSEAQDVVVFQMKLREKGFYNQQADGDFGPATESAVKDMQLHYGFEPTGVTSPDLMRLLGL